MNTFVLIANRISELTCEIDDHNDNNMELIKMNDEYEAEIQTLIDLNLERMNLIDELYEQISDLQDEILKLKERKFKPSPLPLNKSFSLFLADYKASNSK